jgi:hypothetical protein
VLFSPIVDLVAGGATCGMRLAAQFLDDPAKPLDTTCVANLPPVAFVGP